MHRRWHHLESVGVNAAEAAVPVDVAVAEKVAFWLTNDVQNAELKLDGLGEQPLVTFDCKAMKPMLCIQD